MSIAPMLKYLFALSSKLLALKSTCMGLNMFLWLFYCMLDAKPGPINPRIHLEFNIFKY